MLSCLGDDFLHLLVEPLASSVEFFELSPVEAQGVVTRLPQPRKALVQRFLLLWGQAEKLPTAAIEYEAQCGC